MENSFITDADSPPSKNGVHFYSNSREYIKAWAAAIETFAKNYEDRSDKNNTTKPAIIHSGLLFGNDTYLGGYTKKMKTVKDTLADAVKTGIDVYMLLDGGAKNSYSFFNGNTKYSGNSRTAQELQDVGVKTLLIPGKVAWSKHDKGTVFINDQREVEKAFIGIDIARHREDGPLHKKDDPDRHPGVQPTHDNGILIEGPASGDVADFFITQWNRHVPGKNQIDASISRVTAPKDDAQWVQILRTDHNANKFTIYDSYIRAIDNAENAIYIQDQYFWPDTTLKGFEAPKLPGHGTVGEASDSTRRFAGNDLLEAPKEPKSIREALGKAIERGVDVVVLVPPDDTMESKGFEDSQKFQRTEDARFLNSVAEESPGSFSIVHRPWVYVHAKTMIVDDQVLFVGSGNLIARSMFGDSEIASMVFGNDWVGNVRKNVFERHLGIPKPRKPNEPSPLHDINMKVACKILKDAAMMGDGNLALHPIEKLPRPPLHGSVMSIINRSGKRPGQSGISRR
jgi:phosphatidylserine/phosphatidylglycerophosphate/cardiolipin synthase-like enzyme